MDVDEFLAIGEFLLVDDLRQAFSVKRANRGRDISDWNLTIYRVTPPHAGVYECQITSTEGFVKHVRLNVVGELKLPILISLSFINFYECIIVLSSQK